MTTMKIKMTKMRERMKRALPPMTTKMRTKRALITVTPKVPLKKKKHPSRHDATNS